MEARPLSIRLLGPFEVRLQGQPWPSVRARSVEWLLTLLVLRHGRDVSRSWLAGTLWPQSPEARALLNLRRNLMELRQALGAEAARLRSPNRATLGLDLTGAAVDVVAFDAAIAAGDERSLQAAVALYRGPLLEGCVEEWAFPERASREEACLQALERLADRAAERGELAAALGYLGQASALDPLRDSTQRRRMQALAASGDLPAAFLTYREHRLRLHRELNVEPDPETTQLFQQLRSGVGGAGRRGDGAGAGGAEGAGYPPKVGEGPGPGRLGRAVDRGYPRSGSWGRAPGGRADRVEISPSPRLPVSPSSAPPVSPSPRLPVSPSPLPRPLTALIGREQEVRAVVQAARAARLVTLTGGGGVGKTRLAIQAAEELAGDLPEGAAFIELASLADPALLPAHVAAALGVRETEAGAGTGPESLVQALCKWLASHPVLLVLDNCEHLLQAAASLAHALLDACPALRIVTTSRQRLGITGEVVRRVPSLPAPDPEALPPEERSAVDAVLSYPAAQLLLARAAAVRGEFQVEDRAAAVAVAQICRRLDGIPLALELAAARVGLLTLPQIAARLDDRFRLLTGGSRVALPRHQTLQALIDWSYELLPEAERTLLCRLSVFAGGWTLEAAEAVAALHGSGVRGQGSESGPACSGLTPDPWPLAPHEVLDLLTALEEKSLVLAERRDGAIRYRMLETVREYAREQLAASGELAAVRNRHRDWFLQLAEQADAAARGPEQRAYLARLAAEIDNLRAALAWCFEAVDSGQWRLVSSDKGAADSDLGPAGLSTHHDPLTTAPEAGLRLAAALGWFWLWRGSLAEGLQWLEGALVRGGELPAPLRAAALSQTAYLARTAGGEEKARSLFLAVRQEWEKALALAHGDRREVADAVLALAEVALHLWDVDSAWSYAEEARQQMEALGDHAGLIRATWVMARLSLWRADWQAARPLMEELMPLVRELGDAQLLIHVLGGMGYLERHQENYDRARALYQESLILRRKSGHQIALAQSLEDFAVLAGRERQVEQAIRLLGAAEAFCETLGARPPVADRTWYEYTVAEGRAVLGEEAFAAVWAQGRAMSLDEAIEYALSDAGEARQPMEALEDQGGLIRTLAVMVHQALSRGDRQAARPLMEELLSHVRGAGDAERLIHTLGGLGHLERDEGNYDRARALYQESLILRRKVGNRLALAQSLEDFAVLAGREQRAARAVRLLGAGEAFCGTIGARPPVAGRTDYERTVSEGCAALGEAAFAAAWAEGRAMSLDEALAYALGEE